MPWPTWQQSGVVALLCGVAVVLLARTPEWRGRAIAHRAATELTLISGLYAIWRMARKLPWHQSEGAIGRAYDIVAVQETLGLPSELSLQRLVMRSDLASRLASYYYAGLHVPVLIVFLVWLFWRHLDHFARWRNALAILTGLCLFIRFIRVAPPRFLGELGYVDLPAEYGLSVYGPVGTGVSPQFAAMPSIHVAWAAVVSFGVVTASRHRWRWLALGHLVATVLVVAATGHHWWADGIVAIALLALALLLGEYVPCVTGRRRGAGGASCRGSGWPRRCEGSERCLRRS